MRNLRNISLNQVVLPHDCSSTIRTTSRPKSVVFTNRYVHTANQQRYNLAKARRSLHLQEFGNLRDPESVRPESLLKGGFPVRRSNTNPHKILYKYRHPRKLISTIQPTFCFKVQDLDFYTQCPSKFLSQSNRAVCGGKSNTMNQSQIFTKSQRVQLDSKSKKRDPTAFESIKIAGWNTSSGAHWRDCFV